MMLRKLLIGAFVVAALAIAGAVALLVFFDINRFKPQIEQAALERLQRRLVIEGDLSLSVLPRLAVSLPRTTLYERNDKDTLATLDRARVGVDLLPLLAGRVEVDRVRIDGLSARIRRASNGSTNIDDLLQRDKPAPAAPRTAQSRPLDFDIGGVELVDAELRLIEPDGTTTLTGLTVKTGRIARGTRLPIDAATKFALPSKTAGEAKLAAALTFDPAQRAYGAEGVKLEIKTADVEARLTAPKLQLAGDVVRGDGIALAFKRGGAAPADVTIEVAAFDGPAKALGIPRVDVAAGLRQGERRIVAALSSPAQANVDARTLALPQLTGEMTVDDPGLPMKSLKLPIAGALAVDARKQSLDLRADTRFDDTTLNARIDVDDFARPRIGFDVKADRFDLDRYSAPAAAGKGAAGGAPAQIDFSALRTLNAAGQIAIGDLKARGLKATGVRIGVKAANGRADLAPVAAQLYGGTLNGSARAVADGNRVAVDATLANVAVGPLLNDVLNKQPIEGRGNVRLAITAAGATADAMKRALDGTASLRIRDGAVRGIDVVRKLRDARALIAGGKGDAQQANSAEKTDFSELAVSFKISNGVARSDDLDLKSSLLRAGGAGQIDLAAGTIDYTVRVTPTGVAELRGVTVPLRLAGPFEQLTYTVDWSGVAREALKSKLVDEQRKKLEERALDALKGLLRR